MTHSAEFNARRREAYAEARLLGLTPREAGHLYWRPDDPRFQSRVNSHLSETNRSAPVVPRTQYGLDYYFHGTYTLVRVRTRDHEGEIHTFTFTVARGPYDVPTRGQLLDAARGILRANASRYPEKILGLTFSTTLIRGPK